MNNDLIEIEVTPIRELFPYKEADNFGIYAVEPEEDYPNIQLNKYGNIAISGTMPRLNLFTKYKVQLMEKNHPRYGLTYEVKMVHQDIPTSKEDQKIFLKTLLTELQVENIYKVYPDHDIIELIKSESFEYQKVHGIGLATYLRIRNRILENIEMQGALTHLGKYDIGYNLILKLVKHFGSTALLIQNVDNNPYCLTAVSGIGFKKADQIARSMGFDMSSHFRIEAAIKYTIEEEEKNGNTYIKQEELLAKVQDLILIDEDLIFDVLWEIDGVVIIDQKVALENTYKREVYIAESLLKILKSSTTLEYDVEAFISEQEQEFGMTLTEQQRSFFTNIKNHNVNFLIGYAGCGKSQLQKLLINLLDKLGLTYRLMAPTGKAAKVLSKYTDREVSTIHRAIGLGKAQKDKDEEDYGLMDDFIIIDETSMLDVFLAAATFRKIKNENVRILFIGDPFQIPSVSAGNFLYDMVESKVFPVTKLDIVFRQSEGGILDLATKVRKGEKFIDNNFQGITEFGNNAVLASVPQEKMVGGYKYYVQQLLQKYGIDDIMILSPTKKRDLGTVEINSNVQSIVNPSDKNKSEVEFRDAVYRENDNVINIKNTYDVETVRGNKVDIVNGDTGTIQSVDHASEEMIIDYGFADVPVSFDELDNILHSYCITMHKAQGSSAKAVVVLMDKSHKFQLNANLVYTAWTRPEEFLVILCQADVINFAMKKVVNLQRNTWMRGILREMT